MSLEPIRFVQVGDTPPTHYNGILINASAGLHEQVSMIAGNLFPDGGPERILDIATGNGALATRLAKRWPSAHTDGVDLAIPSIGHPGPTYHICDLNDGVALGEFVDHHRSVYDLVTGIETIEHIENPWQYLRAIKTMLTPGGYAIVSTPNVGSAASKVWYALTDRHLHFGDDALIYGHINPVSAYEIETICHDIGLHIVESRPGGTYPIIWIRRPLAHAVVYTIANLVLGPLTRGMRFGWCSVYILRNDCGET